MPDEQKPRPTPQAKLPPQTIERWRAIVQRAVRNNTDISQLVQHFAERAFKNKTVGLDSQGARRRALTHMRQTLSRELTRAKKAMEEHADSKSSTLMRPYQGITLTFLPPVRVSPRAKKTSLSHVVPLALDGDTQASKSAPLKDKCLTTQELQAYMRALNEQGDSIDKEMADIDEVLNRGMHNRDSTVAELSATTQELWRIAQEEVAIFGQEAAIRQAAAPMPGPLPVPLSDEKTAALIEATHPNGAAHPPTAAAAAHTALARGKTLLDNMQALFKKKS